MNKYIEKCLQQNIFLIPSFLLYILFSIHFSVAYFLAKYYPIFNFDLTNIASISKRFQINVNKQVPKPQNVLQVYMMKSWKWTRTTFNYTILMNMMT